MTRLDMTGLDGSTSDRIERDWIDALAGAARVWSPYLELGPPVFCRTVDEERAAGLDTGFLRVRYADRRVAVSLRRVAELGIGRYPEALLAHAVGHLVLAPGDLSHHARLLARSRAGLAGQERFAPLVANVWADLVVDTRLHDRGVDLIEPYRQVVAAAEPSPLLRLHLRAHEILTSASAGSLLHADGDEQFELEARLAARLVRTHQAEWLSGATRFALLARPLVVEALTAEPPNRLSLNPDNVRAGQGPTIPVGMATLDWIEQRRAHPVDDAQLTGLRSNRLTVARADRSSTAVAPLRFRAPSDYLELLTTIGVTASRQDMVSRYYHDRIKAETPTPPAETDEPARDLLLVLDAAPEALDPGLHLSTPALLGCRVALDARRRGRQVAVVWSTPPNAAPHSTDGFTSDDDALLAVLTRPAAGAATPTVGQLADLADLVADHPDPIDLLVVADQRLLETLDQHSRSHTTGAWALVGELGRGARATVVLSGTTSRSRSGLRSLARQGWIIRTVDDGAVTARNIVRLLEAVA